MTNQIPGSTHSDVRLGARERLCVISARGGSQGVPGKNSRMLHGKPVIAWTIEKALASRLFAHVAVSTDSADIAEAASRAGADVPFVRPAELATPSVGKFQVWQHARKACEAHYGTSFDTYVDIDCTNPLLDVEDYVRAVELFDGRRGSIDAVMTVSPARRNPYFNLVEPDANGMLHMSKSLEETVVARQAAPAVFEHVAGIYVLEADYLTRCNHLLDGRVIAIEVPPEKAQDIDTPLDFELISFLLGRSLGVRG